MFLMAAQAAEAEREGPVQGRLYRSLKLWAFYCDLEESLGTLESTRAVYDRILDLRIATPQIILNYALFLQVICLRCPVPSFKRLSECGVWGLEHPQFAHCLFSCTLFVFSCGEGVIREGVKILDLRLTMPQISINHALSVEMCCPCCTTCASSLCCVGER